MYCALNGISISILNPLLNNLKQSFIAKEYAILVPS